ncbi:Cytosolic carboxypeptidase 6 [Frankliniella fusca]|uniref:Cytosolic carboxypeptidase 6 n=1 Tax=Frankliniella fusca TaxID=407009 RepID=A0AAE1H0D3_9NEOP|nr:Cytosolic carboxypeptidase 6 [Frankliniella fusca]
MPDSDDSESEGGLGNVSRVVMRPPGHSGKAKKGHLCFDAAFETGETAAWSGLVRPGPARPGPEDLAIHSNLGRVDLVNEYEYDLFIRPDTCNPRFRIWFHFTVDNIRLDQVGKREHVNVPCCPRESVCMEDEPNVLCAVNS